MRPLQDDIVEFIHSSFRPQDVPRVFEILQDNADLLSTPRVQRSVLFLSGGSLSMLRHYVTTAELNLPEVLIRAEHVLDVATAPMPIRSMAEKFNCFDAGTPADAAEPAATPVPERKAPRRAGNKGLAQGSVGQKLLAGGRFMLRDVEYIVTTEQHHRDRVRCLRLSGNVVSIVHLPLVFVMEQLSEEYIELEQY